MKAVTVHDYDGDIGGIMIDNHHKSSNGTVSQFKGKDEPVGTDTQKYYTRYFNHIDDVTKDEPVPYNYSLRPNEDLSYTMTGADNQVKTIGVQGDPHTIGVSFILPHNECLPNGDQQVTTYVTKHTGQTIHPTAPSGYHTNEDTTYQFQPTSNPPEIIHIYGNQIKGTATVTLKNQSPNGKKTYQTKTVQIPINTNVGTKDVIVNPEAYVGAGYKSRNNPWIIHTNWKVAPNGDNLKYNPTQTFTYHKIKPHYYNIKKHYKQLHAKPIKHKRNKNKKNYHKPISHKHKSYKSHHKAYKNSGKNTKRSNKPNKKLFTAKEQVQQSYNPQFYSRFKPELTNLTGVNDNNGNNISGNSPLFSNNNGYATIPDQIINSDLSDVEPDINGINYSDTSYGSIMTSSSDDNIGGSRPVSDGMPSLTPSDVTVQNDNSNNSSDTGLPISDATPTFSSNLSDIKLASDIRNAESSDTTKLPQTNENHNEEASVVMVALLILGILNPVIYRHRT